MSRNTAATRAKKSGDRRPLTQRESDAVSWAKSNYPRWRVRFNETVEEHAARIPEHMRLASYYPQESRDREIARWQSYYDHPFGIPEWNENVQILHSLFSEGVL